MAYTSILPVHRLDNGVTYVLNPKKTSRSQNADSLEDAVDYALNRDKTQQDLFESAMSCTCETAFSDMCCVKEMWHKPKGVQGFHLVQSFAAGEVSPELAHRIGQELAQQLLGGRFQVVISTHLNTGHIHNHLVWNSVCIQTGKKYRSNHKSYITEVRRASDELCKKYGLSIIQTKNAEKAARPYIQWQAEQNAQPTWKTAIQQDIDDAVGIAFTWKQFLRILQQQGYALKLDRKYITLQPPGKARPVRFKTLGGRYTPEAIQQRILAPNSPPPAKRNAPLPRRMVLRTKGKPPRKLTGLRALYFSYLYRMGVLPRKPRYPSPAVRQDIRRLDQRLAQMRFLSLHEIDSREQLATLRLETESQIAVLLRERQKLYRYAPQSPQIRVFTDQLRGLRRTVKLCRSIETQSVEMEQRMRAAALENQQRQKQQAQEKHTTQTNKER